MLAAVAAASYNGDPVFAKGITLGVWIIELVKLVAVFAIIMVGVLFMVMYERKAVAYLGNRWGPNRAGPKGWLQSLADGLKLFFKEALVPEGADRWVYRAAPVIAMVPVMVSFSVIPIGDTVTVAGYTTRLQLADPPWGILVMLMASSISVYGVMLAGWASGSKYPLIGAVRASAQMISYEAALGLTVATVVVLTGSLHTSAIVAAQHGGVLYHWNVFRAYGLPAAIFFVAITAEMTRPPFDLVEAEEELAGGYNMEYSSIGFALFYLAEYAALVTNSAFFVTLFLGGPDGPYWHTIGPLWFVIKVLAVLYVYVWIRATLPRLRYDQLMDLGWKKLIPASLAMLLIVAAGHISWRWGLAALSGSLFAFILLSRAIEVGRTQVEEGAQAELESP
ncbi:MAG: NADH-quinone oxidoreductase subunit H [Actinomycetota bacterium]|jgi:NADH-quinone oxidoreductase subunit H|nr:NADH-quinone oxidoreductase subunit H [Actinomycetota bacterium]